MTKPRGRAHLRRARPLSFCGVGKGDAGGDKPRPYSPAGINPPPNNVGADAHIGPPIRPQIDRGRVWTPAATVAWYAPHVGAALVAARPNPAAGTSPAPAVLRVSFRLLNNVGADAHIGPLIRPQIDRGRVWAPAPTALQ